MTTSVETEPEERDDDDWYPEYDDDDAFWDEVDREYTRLKEDW